MLFFRSFSFHDGFCVWLCHICSHWMVPFLDMYHSIMYICTCDMLHVSEWEISCSLCCQIHNTYGLHFVLYVPIHCIWSIVLWCFYRMYISLTSRHFFSLFSSFYLSICSSICLPAQFLSVSLWPSLCNDLLMVHISSSMVQKWSHDCCHYI